MSRKKIIRILLGLGLIAVLGIGGIIRSSTITNPSHWGETMGTSYSIKITGKVRQSDLKKLHQDIKTTLSDLNRQMSTWDPESEISRFNHSVSTEPFPCSIEFFNVVARALEISDSSQGAFDPTLQPLLNLWGFGSEAEQKQVPSDEEINLIIKKTGWKKVELIPPQNMRKTDPDISLALGAIAKGYGVDSLATLMGSNGYENWFVEIGGEVAAKGLSPKGTPWKIGIQFPTINPLDESLQGTLEITNSAVATSGNYRNYIQEEGEIFSHLLDPRIGRTVQSDVASVTVVAPNCMDADAMATAAFVMGTADGLKWVESHRNVECMFLVRRDNEIIELFSSGFRKLTGYNSLK